MDIATLLQGIKTNDGLCPFIDEILEKGALPLWNEETTAIEIWIDKAKTDENVDMVNAVTQLCIKYIQILQKEEEKESIIYLYLRLNSLVELVNNWPSPYLWTVFAFWESISELQMAILRACPDKLHSYLLDLGHILLKTTMKSSLPIFLRQLRIKGLNSLLEDSPTEIRVAFKEDIKSKLPLLLSMLHEIGDYDYQTSIVETIFRLTFPAERVNQIEEWFPDLDKDTRLLFININDFDPDCRKFLNTYNKLLGSKCKVFSFKGQSAFIGKYELRKPKLDSYEYLWIDFNSDSNTVSLLFDHATPDVPTQERVWETIMVYANEVDKAVLELSSDLCILKLHLNKNPSTFFASPPAESVAKQLSSEFSVTFSFNPQLESVCSNMFQSRLRISKHTNDPSSRSSVTHKKMLIDFDDVCKSSEPMRTKESATLYKIAQDSSQIVNSEVECIPGTDPDNQTSKTGWSIIRKKKPMEKRKNVKKKSIKDVGSTSQKNQAPANLPTITKPKQTRYMGDIPSVDKSESRIMKSADERFPIMKKNSDNIESLLESFENQGSTYIITTPVMLNLSKEISYDKMSLDEVFSPIQKNMNSEEEMNELKNGLPPNTELNENVQQLELITIENDQKNMKDYSDSSIKSEIKSLLKDASPKSDTLEVTTANIVKKKFCSHSDDEISVWAESKDEHECLPFEKGSKLCTPLVTTLEILSKYPLVVKEPKTPTGHNVVKRLAKSTSSKFEKTTYSKSPKTDDRNRKSKKSLFNVKSCTLLDNIPQLTEDIEVIYLNTVKDSCKDIDCTQKTYLTSDKTIRKKEILNICTKSEVKKPIKKRKKVTRKPKNINEFSFSSEDDSNQRRHHKKPKVTRRGKVYPKNKCSTPKPNKFFQEDETIKVSKVDIYSDLSDDDDWLKDNCKSHLDISKKLTQRTNKTYGRKSSTISERQSSPKKKVQSNVTNPRISEIATIQNKSISSWNDSKRKIITRSVAKNLSKNSVQSIVSSIRHTSPEVLRESLSNLNSVDDRLSFDADFSLVPTAGSRRPFSNNKYSDISKDYNNSWNAGNKDYFRELLEKNSVKESSYQSSDSMASMNSNSVYVDTKEPELISQSVDCLTERKNLQLEVGNPTEADFPSPEYRIRYVQEPNSSFCNQHGPIVCETLTESPCLNDNLPVKAIFYKSVYNETDKSISANTSDKCLDLLSDVDLQEMKTGDPVITTDTSIYRSMSGKHSVILPLNQTEPRSENNFVQPNMCASTLSSQHKNLVQPTPILGKPKFQTPKLKHRKLFPQVKKNARSSSLIRLLLDEISIVRRAAQELDARCKLISDVMIDLFENK